MKLLTFDKYWQRGLYLANDIYYKKVGIDLWSFMSIQLKCHVFENGLKHVKEGIMDGILKNKVTK